MLVVHVKDPMDDDPPPPHEEHGNPPPPPARGEHVLRRLLPRRQGRSASAHHVSVQRRPGLLDGVAAHGRVRPEARAHRRRHAQPRRSLSRRRQRIQPDRRERPGVHRCARHRLRPSARQRQGEGVLRRRPGRACVRQFHRRIPVAPQALELAEVSVRRELRNHAIGGALEHSAEREGARPERHHSALAGIELRRQRRRAAVQPGRRSALRARAADLRGHGLVSPQAAQSAGGARAVAARGREFRAQRLCAGARRRLHA